MQPGCWLHATQPATSRVGAGEEAATAGGYMESSASVATLASISSIASTSAAARAALKARPYMVPPFVATASAPPTPQPHTTSDPPSSTARTAPATPTRRRLAPEEDPDLVEDFDVALAQLEEPQPPSNAKAKSQRFFWRKAIRRVFQRRK
ncbi:hypothetical protein KR200_010189 [Drosophila serrata]|nr:hypothetical protein KR200_010189 [Drosophila serrata]